MFNYFPEYIYENPITIRSIHNTENAEFSADIPVFSEFESNEAISFISHKFHDYFERLIGLQDLQNLNLTKNLQDNLLENSNIQLPILKLNRNAYDKTTLIKLPVDKLNSDIFIEFTSQTESVIIPEQLTTSHGNHAIVEIRIINETHTASVDLHYVVQTTDFYTPTSVEINNHLSIISCNKDIPTDTPIDQLIRTNHLNNEERSLILNLCEKYRHFTNTWNAFDFH